MTVRYAVAVIAVLAALGIRMALDPVLGSNAPYLVFVLAVVVAARFGGRKPGWLATALSTLAVAWFFLAPRGSFAVDTLPSATGLGLFLLVGVVVSYLAPRRQLSSGSSPQVGLGNIGAPEVSRFSARQLHARSHVWWFGAAILLLVIEAALFVSVWTRFSDRGHLAAHTYQVLQSVESLSSGIKDAEAGARAYVLSGNEDYLQPYRRALERTAVQIQELQQLTSDSPHQQVGISKLEPLAQQRLRLLAGTIELRSSGGLNAAAEAVTGGQGKLVMDQVNSIIDGMRKDEQSLLAERTGRAAAAATGMQAIMLSGAGLLLLVLIGGSHSIDLNIKNREQAEDALRENETRLRALSDNLPEGMVFRFRLDANGEPYFEFVSAGIERLTGIPAAEFIARRESFDRFIIPEDRDRVRAAILDSRERLNNFELEVRHKHHVAGRVGWSLLRWVATRNSDGSTTWDGVELDITSRKQAQQALVISEQRFRKLFENAAVGIAIMDLDGRLIRSNAAYIDLHGYAENELANKRFGDLMTPEDLQLNLAEVRRLKAGEIPFFRNETRHIREDGRQVWVERFVSLLPGEQGDASELVALISDVTERKRAERQVQELNAELETRVRRRTAQLEAANKELEAFAYSVSHDLRAPLRGIDGWSLALLEDYGGRLDATAHKHLDRVRAETQRMGLLIDDLLQLSRVTRSEMSTAVVDLSSIATAIAARLRERAPERRIEFEIRNGVSTVGDERLIEIALDNLLSNAVKFTGPVEHARVEFGSSTSGGEHLYYVRDNGVGFDMAYSKTLFGAFQRLHKAAEFPGTGIGLATVQRIIHRHGGRVWAESEPGKGTTFYFTIGG
jgi:PAS domain S-box-containing protein